MFIDFVVYPLVEIWAELVSPHAQEMLSLLTQNREYYANLMPGRWGFCELIRFDFG